MKEIQADLHVHVGMSEAGRWIKIPTSAKLTVRNILEEATRKGIDLIGIIDALSPLVQADLETLLLEEILRPLPDGGYVYQAATKPVYLLLGAEIETTEVGGGVCHTLLYLPDLTVMKALTKKMQDHIKNVNMSSQNAHMNLGTLIDIASAYEPLIVPAHIFTPFKSIYGATARRLAEILTEKQIARLSGAEIGLSADSLLADRIAELADFTLFSNSDAHSLDKIGRECNTFLLDEVTFEECKKVFSRQEGRLIRKNYGLDPRLGKYHGTLCLDCGSQQGFSGLGGKKFRCETCQSLRIVRGVYDRIDDIADCKLPQHPDHRPPYHYQMPLNFLPGIGAKTALKLRSEFPSEFYILHQASLKQLTIAVGEKIAKVILNGRQGSLQVATGGGGVYGKVFCDLSDD